MKLPTSLKLAGATVAALAISNAVMAEVALNEQFAVSGYVVGSASYNKVDGSDSDSNMDLDAYKLQSVAKFEKVSVTGSLFAFGPGSGDGFGSSPIVLDAYGTYDSGSGTTVTAGKFLSWLGYEAFDPINMLQITYANVGSTGFIPAYHTGIKVENSTETYTIGVAILDSVYGPTYFKGDGDLDNGVGFEAYMTYKGIENVTLFGGLAYDTGDDANVKSFAADFWIQFVSGNFTFAGEVCYGSKDTPTGNVDGFFVLGLLKYQADDKWAATFRLSAGEGIAEDDFVRATFAPSYAVTKNVEIVAEYSFTDYDGADGHYLGLQTRFKF